jgi:hypothetical protein
MLVKRALGDDVNPWGAAPRSPVIAATYRRGALRAKATLSELTCRTARIDSMENLKEGMLVWITLPGIEARPAIVDWTSGFTACASKRRCTRPCSMPFSTGGWVRCTNISLCA